MEFYKYTIGTKRQDIVEIHQFKPIFNRRS